MAKTAKNNNRLEEAITNLLISQTGLQTSLSKLVEQQVDTDKRWFELRKEMNQLGTEMNQIITILNAHTKVLENLPEAIQKKIGFKTRD